MDEHGQSAMHGVFRFEGWTFDASTGELARGETKDLRDASGEDSAASEGARATGETRLAPQPALLLTMLLRGAGELVTHDEIRAALWPDVEVEFDQGLHFCVRQIRSALSDSAASPRYVQTLPRRGYRWMTAVERDGDAAAIARSAARSNAQAVDAARVTESPAREGGVGVVTPRRLWWPRMTALLALLLLAWLAPSTFRGPDRVRVAIMPFAPPPDGGVTADTREIATHLVATLTADRRLGVIGPTTTERYATSLFPSPDIVSALDLDYIINGRFAERDGRRQLLCELIRADDGEHVWVRWFPDLEDLAVIADTIARETVARMGAS